MKKGKHHTEPEHTREREAETQTQQTGSYLKQLRLDRGMSREDVVKATRVSLTNIIAIEEQAYDDLPADIFAKALITMYGNFLGVDGPAVAARFFEERYQEQQTGKRNRSRKPASGTSLVPKRLAEPTHVSSATVAAILLLLIILSFSLVCFLTGWNPFSFLKTESEKIQTVMSAAFSVDNAHGQHDIYSVEIRFLADTWLEHSIDQAEPVREVFRAGDTKTYEAFNSMELVFEKPASATLTLNSRPLPFPVAVNGHPTLTLPDDLLPPR